MSTETSGKEALDKTGVHKRRVTYTEFLDSAPMSTFLWHLLIVVCLAEFLDGLDFQMTAYALPGIIKTFTLNPAQAGLIPSAGNFGLMIGAIIFSLISDRVGRKQVFQWVLLTFAFGSFLSAIAPSYHALLAARFVAGLGLGAELPVGATILAEFAPSRIRHLFIAIVPFVWAVGAFAAGPLSLWCIPAWGWQSIYWVGIAPALMITFVRFFLPESIRFLVMRGRTEEAGRITNDIARRSGIVNVELVPPVVLKSEVKPNFREQLALLWTVRVPMLTLAFVCFCFYLGNFGINAWLPTIFVRQGHTVNKSFFYSMIIFSTLPFAQLLGAWLQEQINRKWALFSMTVVGTIFLLVFGLSFQYGWPIQVTVTAQLLQGLVAPGVVAIFYTLSAELFPTQVRSIGFGCVQACGRVGGALGPAVVGVLLKFDMTITQVIYFCAAPMLIATTLALFLLRFDPRQRTLEQINEAVKAGSR